MSAGTAVATTQEIDKTILNFRPTTYAAAMDSLRRVWFPRIRYTTEFWNPPYPNQHPEFRDCLGGVAMHSKEDAETFWKELLENMPAHKVVWLCDDGRCDCWKGKDMRDTWVNFKKARRLRRELWHELGRLASRRKSSTEAFRQSFLRHAQDEPVAVAIRHVRRITGEPKPTAQALRDI